MVDLIFRGPRIFLEGGFMPTSKQRVNMTLDLDTAYILRWLSFKSGKSISEVCSELVREALAFNEDAYYYGLKI